MFALFLCACDGGETSAAGGGGQAGGGGATPEGCVDIEVSGDVLPDGWRELVHLYSGPAFWIDETGVHVAWESTAPDDYPYVVVHNHDGSTGALQSYQIFGDHRAGSERGSFGLYDVAGGPDGSFAVVRTRPADPATAPVFQLLLGNILTGDSQPWLPPWTEAESGILDVAWDGDAWAVHGFEGPVTLTRVAIDGTILSGPTPVGGVTSVFEESVQFHTDPTTGRSWFVSDGMDGVWLGGHDRLGEPLAGPDPLGAVFIQPRGIELKAFATSWPAIASHGDDAMLAWLDEHHSGHWPTVLQPVHLTTPSHAAIALHGAVKPAGRKALARAGDGWVLALHKWGVGIEAHLLSDDGPVVETWPLVRYERCSVTCSGPSDGPQRLELRHFAGQSWNGEAWVGFEDLSDIITVGGSYLTRSVYRVVKAKPGCTYLSAHDKASAP